MKKTNQPIVFGSYDSTDLDKVYIFDSMPSPQKCKEFCDRNRENRNIITLEDGLVKDTYKGLPDEMNNALYHTYKLHEQEAKNPVTKPVKRIVPLKIVRANRIFLSLLSRTNQRPKIKYALNSYSFSERKDVMSEIDFRRLDVSKDDLKSIAFQLGQTIALIEGQEVYTKVEISRLFKDLRPFLYREPVNPQTLNKHRDRLIDLLKGVYTRQTGALNLFCYENAPAVKDWNQFIRQCRGMVIDMKKERCIHYPYDKFFRINEVPETREANLPKDSQIELVEKLDGSMISCFEHSGQVIFACKGNFNVEQSRKAEELARKKQTIHILDFDKYHYVFELICPENRFPNGLNIVDYGDREELVLVGLRNRLTNEMLPYSKVIGEAKKQGLAFPRSEQRDLENIIRLSRQKSGLREEGWVARFDNGMYVKIKYKDYLEALKAANDMKNTTFLKKERRGMHKGYEVTHLPGHLREVACSKLKELEKTKEQIRAYFERVSKKHGHEFPYFALKYVQPYKFQKPLLRFWRGQPYEHLLDRLVLNIHLGKLEMPNGS